MTKNKLPPAFRKAAKKATKAGPSKGARVVAPNGAAGVVQAAMGGMVKVKHDDGKTRVHPAGNLRKVKAVPVKKKAAK